MKIRLNIISVFFILVNFNLNAQSQAYSLSDCINRALEYNLQVRQAGLTTEIKQANREQAVASRFPTLNANARQDYSWSDQVNSVGNYDFTRYSGSSLSVNSGLVLFNGFRKENTIKQAALEYQGSMLDVEEMRQSISLQVLDNYLQVLYAGELVTNSKNQLISTGSQIELAKERLDLRIISQADYLQVKAQEASEKLTLANAEKQLQLTRLNLMQLLELPVNDSFAIVTPDFSTAGKQALTADANGIFENALGFRPEVKSAAIQKLIAGYDVEIAKSGYIPSLSINAGIMTSYSSSAENLKYASQLDHNLTPTLGLTLSVPIFQQKQVKSQVSIAKINATSAEISEQITLNQLRKSIESAWVEVLSAEKEFDAGTEQYNATSASFDVATERFNLGVINSVDFLYEKTNLINAESQLLQARYNLIFSYKVLEFYQGKALEL
jgi:outer membrane protein